MAIPTINHKIIGKIIGVLLIIEGVFMTLCLPFSVYYLPNTFLQYSLFNPENDFWALLISAAITIFSGILLLIFSKTKDMKSIGKREGYLIVTSTWIVISIFGSLPFLLSGTISQFTNAFFETISGFTTTGASILLDIEAMPKGILFWRSMTHWIGGMGIIVFSLAILPVLGIGGMQLFVAEMPGPTPDKLHPKISKTAMRLWGIYILLTIVETVLLIFGGMNLFDAICHAFGTMATGGFSTQNDSVASFSPYIQYVIIVFMILAGTNFTLHYLNFLGRTKEVFKNEEFRFYLSFIVGFAFLIGVLLIILKDLPIETAFRHSLFQVVSIITTTGFVSYDYLQWPRYLWIILFFLMFLGGSAGSTGGGVKVFRQILVIKNVFAEFNRLIHPQAIIPVRYNKKSVSEKVVYNVLAFFILYLAIFGISTVVMSFIGLDYQSSIGAVAATLGNIGPGIGAVGPVENYDTISIAGKWYLSFLMLLGRLEIFTVLIIFTPVFWKR